jgi:hypothetical protein
MTKRRHTHAWALERPERRHNDARQVEVHRRRAVSRAAKPATGEPGSYDLRQRFRPSQTPATSVSEPGPSQRATPPPRPGQTPSMPTAEEPRAATSAALDDGLRAGPEKQLSKKGKPWIWRASYRPAVEPGLRRPYALVSCPRPERSASPV